MNLLGVLLFFNANKNLEIKLLMHIQYLTSVFWSENKKDYLIIVNIVNILSNI